MKEMIGKKMGFEAIPKNSDYNYTIVIKLLCTGIDCQKLVLKTIKINIYQKVFIDFKLLFSINCGN